MALCINNRIIIKMNKFIKVNCDGGARGNPGPAAIGVIIKNEHNKLLYESSKYIGIATNNVAEYQAVVDALLWLKNNFSSPSVKSNVIEFYLDSKLVVNQLSGIFKVKNKNLQNLIIEIRKLENDIKSFSNAAAVFIGARGVIIKYFYIPREKNSSADYLVNKSLDNL